MKVFANGNDYRAPAIPLCGTLKFHYPHDLGSRPAHASSGGSLLRGMGSHGAEMPRGPERCTDGKKGGCPQAPSTLKLPPILRRKTGQAGAHHEQAS